MAKQWLNEYTSGLSGTSGTTARIRQHRLNNLMKWHVDDIVGTIPVLLQLALLCFLAGLLVLLWGLHSTVAAIASMLVGLLSSFILITTVCPLFDDTCAYLSPQARALESIPRPAHVIYWTRRLPPAVWSMCKKATPTGAVTQDLRVLVSAFLSTYKNRVERPARLLLKWVSDSSATYAPRKTRQGREWSLVSKLEEDLDRQSLFMVYDTTLHPDAISAASVCLMDLPSTQVLLYWQQLQTSAAEHFGAESERATELISPLENELLWLHILICAAQQHNALPEMLLRKFLYFRGRMLGLQAAEADWTYYAFRSLYDQELEEGGLLMQSSVPGQWMVDLKLSRMIELVLGRDIPWGAVVIQGVTHAYRCLRLRSLDLSKASNDKIVYREYFRSVTVFLRLADRFITRLVSASNHGSHEVKTIRAYARDVLEELMHDVLTMEYYLRIEARTPYARDYGESQSLDELMQGLFLSESDDLLGCLPDGFVEHLMHIANDIEGAVDSCEDTPRLSQRRRSKWCSDLRRYANQLQTRTVAFQGDRLARPLEEHPSTELRVVCPAAALKDVAAPLRNVTIVDSALGYAGAEDTPNTHVSPTDPSEVGSYGPPSSSGVKLESILRLGLFGVPHHFL
ncbi:hypothetical protein VTO73DRAFT_8987 [Trametes versicolor]